MKIKQLFKVCLVGAICVSTAACASRGVQDSESVDVAVARTNEGFEDAALAPLSDLNLRKAEIPQRLKELTTPYAELPTNGCRGIREEVTALTAILGHDVDYHPDEDDDNVHQAAGEEAANFTLDTVESATTGFIPFRGLVRRATGASAHEKRLRDAYQRGLQRRAYLKGVGKQMGCIPPASPLEPMGDDVSKVEYRKVAPK